MRALLHALFNPMPFSPPENYSVESLWLLWCHAGAETVFAFSYLVIALGLAIWVRRRPELLHRPMLLFLSCVLAACGIAHALNIWTLGHAYDWLSGGIHGLTAVATAIGAWCVLALIPKTIELSGQRSVEKISASMAREISVRESVEEALERNRRFLTSVLENIPDMIFVKSADELRFVRINQAGLDLLGRTPEEMIGKNDYDFFPKSEAEFFIEKDRNVLRQKGLIDIPEEPIHTRNRGVRYLHTKKIPILDARGEPIYLLGISEDITERKMASETLKKTYDDLEHRTRELTVANHGLEAFSYSVSHDLRAPLRAIEGFAQILLEEQMDRLDDEGKRLLNIIRSNTLHMSQLIDDLLAFSRIGAKHFNKQSVDMNALVREVVEEMTTTNQKAAITINPLPKAWGDPALLRQVWINLISNAVKFSRHVAVPGIEVGSDHSDGVVGYYVKDRGVGFDMRYADKLFGVFQRLHSTEEFEGTGVGLAIVQRIIHKHGGRIWADSAINEGATFSFSLPRSGASDELS